MHIVSTPSRPPRPRHRHRHCRWHFQWWVPAERFQFLKPWGDYSRASAEARNPPRPSSYAPPRPTAQPAVPPPAGGAVGEEWGINGDGGGSSEQTSFLEEDNGHGLDELLKESV